MRSTEDSTMISDFYHEKLIPVAVSLRDRQLPLFELRANPSCSTYYVKRSRTRVEPSDFEKGGCEGPEGLEAELAALWKKGGARDEWFAAEQPPAGEELAKLAGPIAELSKRLYSAREQDAEVSPFLYVMF